MLCPQPVPSCHTSNLCDPTSSHTTILAALNSQGFVPAVPSAKNVLPTDSLGPFTSPRCLPKNDLLSEVSPDTHLNTAFSPSSSSGVVGTSYKPEARRVVIRTTMPTAVAGLRPKLKFIFLLLTSPFRFSRLDLLPCGVTQTLSLRV